MDATSTRTLVDELSGDSVEIDPDSTVTDVIRRRVEAADHPRADFRGRPLPYELLGDDGTALDPAQRIAATARVSLVGPEAADVRARRDRWLADIEVRGTATTSVSTATHLALVERTGSRLADVQRLRAELAARRPAPPATPHPGRVTGRRLAMLAGLGAVTVAIAAGAWWLVRFGGADDVAAGSEVGDRPPGAAGDGDVVTLPAELELHLEPGTTNRTIFAGTEGQVVTILMLAPQNRFGPSIDAELELLDGDGNQIGYNDDRIDIVASEPGVNGLNARIDVTLPADGSYTVVSGDLRDSAGGTYQLVIEEGGPGGDGVSGGAVQHQATAPPAPAEPGALPTSRSVGCGYREPVEVAVPFDGPLDVSCEIAVIAFNVPDGGGPVVVTASSPIHDPIVWLLDASGAQVAANDDAFQLNSRLALDLAPGQYVLEVGNLNGEPATIDLLIELP